MLGDGNFKTGFADALPDSAKPYAETLKNFTSFEKLLAETHRLSQLGANSIKIPGTDAKPDEIAAFRKAYGAGEKPEDYGIDNKELAKLAHETGMPKAAVSKLVEHLKAQETAAATKAVEDHNAAVMAAIEVVKSKLGDKAPEVMQKVGKLVSHYKVKPEILDKIASPELMLMLGEFVRWTEEHDKLRTGLGLPDGVLASLGENPEAQMKSIIHSKNDPRNDLYLNPTKDGGATRRLVNDLAKRVAAERAAKGIM